MRRVVMAIAVLVAAGSVLAAPPRKPWLSWQDAMVLWLGPVQQEQVQKPKPTPGDNNWGGPESMGKPKKNCQTRTCNNGGSEATNYPPYNLDMGG